MATELIKAAEEFRRSGMRDDSIAAARGALQLMPERQDALLCLASALTMGDLYIHNPALGSKLAEDGSLDEAITLRERAIALGNSDYDNVLQIGYCLTCKGDYAGGASYIRRASDIFQQERRPETIPCAEIQQVLKPSFFVIGTAKCGTTSLFNYITSHPDVLSPVMKEMQYFQHPERGLDWYLSHFPRKPEWTSRFITGEASVSTINIIDGPAELKQMNPDARIITLARNPVDRAISHYFDFRRLGIETRSLPEAINDELDILESAGDHAEYWKHQKGYIWHGRYATELERWLTVFPSDQLLVLITEELRRAPADTMRRVFTFLRLPPHGVIEFRAHHEGVYDQQDQGAVRQRMDAYFEDHNERFYEIIGKRLNWSMNRKEHATPPVSAASRARIRYQQGRWAEAVAEFDACLRQAPAHPERLNWLESRSLAYLKSGNAAAALDGFLELDRTCPEDLTALLEIAEAASLADDTACSEQAIEVFIRRVADLPDRKMWIANLSQTLFKLGDWIRARRVFEILALAFPQESAGNAGLAWSVQASGNARHAAQLWEVCLRRFPDDAERRWWIPAYAHAQLQLQDLKGAERTISDHLAEFPDDASGLSLLAHLAQHRGNTAQAVEIWEECLRKFPFHPDRNWWLLTVGQLLLQRGEAARAEEVFQRMSEEFPRDPLAIDGLAQVALARGDLPRAGELWKACLSLSPDHQKSSEWTGRLQIASSVETADSLARS